MEGANLAEQHNANARPGSVRIDCGAEFLEQHQHIGKFDVAGYRTLEDLLMALTSLR